MNKLPVVNERIEERRILPEMTVRDINARYPACRAVFARHGMGGCGGELGPDEPLEFFAAAHRVDLCCLQAELERAATGELTDTVSPALAFEKRLARLTKTYIRAAIAITLTAGTAWGAHILGVIAYRQSFDAPSYAGTQAHGHAQIYGWVGLFIMGVAYFSLPKILNARLRSLWPGWTVFGLMFTGIVLRAVAQPLAARPWLGWSAEAGWLLLGSAVLELLAVVVFVVDLGALFWRSEQPRQVFERFIQASLAALVLLAAWNLALVVPLWRGESAVIADPANSRFLYLAVFGFIVNMILGYSLRLLPIFLGLRPLRQGWVLPALALFNAGVAARLFGWSLASGALTFAGMVVYVGALRIFEPPAGEVKSRGVVSIFPWFVRLAYFWFAAAVTMVAAGDLYLFFTGATPAHIFTGSWRHAVTVGFITTLMVGLGYRLLPLFVGADLWRPGLMRVSFWLLAVGNTTRVVFELATATGERWTYLVMGSSGVLELAALTLFGVGLWKTLGRRQQVLVSDAQIGAKTHVRWLLDNFPEARQELIRAGLVHLQGAKFVPYFVTLEQAAKIHDIAVEPIVSHLQAALRPAGAAESESRRKAS